MPFRWPNTFQDVMLATEVAQQRPKCPADYEEIARVLSPIFSEDKKPVVLSGRACRGRMNGLISKYLEEDKMALKRSGTEEEYSEPNQLLEDINTFRKDMEDEAKKARETKKRKEKDDREKGEEIREAALIGMAIYTERKNSASSSSSESSSSDESSKENEASASTSKCKTPAKGKKNEKKKRASKLTVLERLEEKIKQKAVLKEKELEQRRLELEFQKRKYEDEAKERKEKLNQDLEERRLLFALLKDKV